jgi:hypothetical protein
MNDNEEILILKALPSLHSKDSTNLENTLNELNCKTINKFVMRGILLLLNNKRKINIKKSNLKITLNFYVFKNHYRLKIHATMILSVMRDLTIKNYFLTLHTKESI